MVVAPKIKTFHTFDRNIFRKKWSQINEGPLKKAGLLIRRVAINKIGRTVGKKTKPRPPGMPPRSRSGGKELKRIFSVVNARKGRAVIGPVGFSNPPVPALHEHGEGAIRLVRKKSQRDPTGRLRRGRKGRFLKARFGVQYRAYVKFRKRPFMQPALEKIQPQLPAMWRGSVRA